MSKALFLIAGVLLMACTLTEQDKAERLVKGYLERNANDPSSVQIIEFGNVMPDSVTSFYMSDEYQIMEDSNQQLINDIELLKIEERYAEAAAKAERGMQLMERIKAKTDSFKPYQRGMRMRLEYRAKNGVGALVKSTANVTFDNGLTKVTSFDDVK